MKQTNRNPWDILGITQQASPQEVKDAFRRLAMKYHPDKSGNTKTFRIINDAYNKIKNKTMVPIIESKPTRMVNLKVSIQQQINGYHDYIEVDDDLFIRVNIPAGSKTGDRFRVKDNNQTFIINIQEHINENFSRSGFSLLATLDVDVITAMTGGHVEMIGPNGSPLVVDISGGISHNEVITIKNKGLMNRKTKQRGNLLLSINIIIPKLDSQDAIEEFTNRLKNVSN